MIANIIIDLNYFLMFRMNIRGCISFFCQGKIVVSGK